jgi:hypothetical protein
VEKIPANIFRWVQGRSLPARFELDREFWKLILAHKGDQTMIRFSAFTSFLLTLLVCFSFASASAQSVDRDQLMKEIDALRAQMNEKEKLLLSPASEDESAFAEPLQQQGTGLLRLLPREKYDGKLSIRGGGAYYSFTRLTHEYGFGTDIGLEQNKLQVGFAGADFGFIAKLGDVPLESLSLEYPGAHFLSTFSAPLVEAEARRQHARAQKGFEVDEFSYSDSLPVLVNTTYLLRSVNYGNSDVLVAFRVLRKDMDGSVVLIWKMLKKFPAPQLAQTRAELR